MTPAKELGLYLEELDVKPSCLPSTTILAFRMEWLIT